MKISPFIYSIVVLNDNKCISSANALGNHRTSVSFYLAIFPVCHIFFCICPASSSTTDSAFVLEPVIQIIVTTLIIETLKKCHIENKLSQRATFN